MPMKPKKRALVDGRYAKTDFYKEVLIEANIKKECPLCTLRWHTNPILKTIGAWFITETFQPYPNARLHFLIIGKRHKTGIEQLSPSDWKDISALQKWAVKKYHLKGGGIAMRFGDTAHTGATITHIHMHLIVPNLKKGRAIPVMFPFG
jgi:diadenosine tetraphosphate (Ap4A) HIT family hydrolase